MIPRCRGRLSETLEHVMEAGDEDRGRGCWVVMVSLGEPVYYLINLFNLMRLFAHSPTYLHTDTACSRLG